MQPGQLPRGRVGSHMTLEVHVVALLDVASGQRAAEPQPHHWRIYNKQQIKTASAEFLLSPHIVVCRLMILVQI